MARPKDQEVAEKVVALWNDCNGWIPGGSYKELAEALGVDPDRLIHFDWDAKRHHYPVPDLPE